jgi:ABC-type transport system involved in multi-copper enzyme maturation permease subunit
METETPSTALPAAAAPPEETAAPAADRHPLLARLAAATVDNPVLVKEFRTRMRGTRAYWILLGYTLLLAGVLAIMYFSYEAQQAVSVDPMTGMAGGFNTQGARELGRAIYWFAFIAQAIMVALITPAITSGAVTIEREQRSYELLVTTPLRPADLIRGKLAAAVSFVVLLLTASLPLVSLSFLVGGVSPAEIFFSYLIMALGAFVYGAFGIFWSATLRTTAAATVVTYLTVLSVFVLTLIPGFIAQVSSGAGTGSMPEVPFQSLNPLMAAFRAVQPEYVLSGQFPSWVGATILNLLLGMLIANSAMARLEHFEPPRPYWTRILATLLWCAGGLFFFGPMLGGMSRGWTSANAVNEHTGYVLWTMLGFLAVAAPVFNTGDLILRRGESALGRYLAGFSPHRMFRDDLSCGVPLVAVWTVFLLVLIPLAVVLNARSGLFNAFDVLIPGGIMIAAIVFGLCGLGNLLSVTLPSRWAACVLTYLAGVVLLVLPYFTMIHWAALIPKPKTVQPLYQLLYFTPDAILQLYAPVSYAAERPVLLFQGVAPPWLVTSTLYLGMGLLCFALTAMRIQQAGKQFQERTPA